MILNLIDLDGTLILNDEATVEVFSKAFKEVSGVEGSIEHIEMVNRRYYKENINSFYEYFGVDANLGGKVCDVVMREYPEKYLNKMKLNEIVLDRITGEEYINVVVTNSRKEAALKILSHFNLNFDVITPDMFKNTKINPKPSIDLYKLAIDYYMKNYDIHCINIFEDSEWGLKAGIDCSFYFNNKKNINVNVFSVSSNSLKRVLV